MKLVVQQGGLSKSTSIKELELSTTINQIKLKHPGKDLFPLKYEIFRYKSKDQLFVIYKNNRRLRNKNSWYEIRALTALSKLTGNNYTHSVNTQNNKGLETEIDGLDTDSRKHMVEVKRTQITQDWIDYYSKKAIKLNMIECIVVGPNFDETLAIPKNITPYVFRADMNAIEKYYQETYQLPELFEPHIQRRHIRVLLQNGKWQGINRVISKTAKHSYTSKFRAVFTNVIRQKKTPIRVYYSLASMVSPVAEYFGKGLPFSKIIAGLDVDGDHKDHCYGKLGYCQKCMESAETKAKKLSEKLDDIGYNFMKLHSGSKGFHFYLIGDNDRILELSMKHFSKFISQLYDEEGKYLIDNVNFKDQEGEIDAHRIFKLPNSIDAGTGIYVKNKFQQIDFNDQIHSLIDT